jgi:general secretion pathway protein I
MMAVRITAIAGRRGRTGRLVAARLRSRLAAVRRQCGAIVRRRPLADEVGEAGFTLVEVIVALAILSAGLSVLLGMISTGLERTGIAGRTAEAASLAQSLLAQVGTEFPVRPDQRDGVFGNGDHWHLTMQPYRRSRDGAERAVELYQVSAQVEWMEGLEPRVFALSTLRLGQRTATQ